MTEEPNHKKAPWWPKVYVVIQRNNVAHEGEANERIIAVRLTRSAADAVVAEHPGTRIEKHIATK